MAFVGTYKREFAPVLSEDVALAQSLGVEIPTITKELPDAKAWITGIVGDKNSVSATLTVYSSPDRSVVLDNLKLEFVPQADVSWDRQAYLIFAERPELAAMTPDE